jgi:hypothetical protein
MTPIRPALPITLRLTCRLEPLSRSFYYEGNNIRMRRWLGLHKFGVLPGGAIALKWRALGMQARKIFVLRDSLFGQQDNLTQHRPTALMLPPPWILAILTASNVKPVHLPPPEDDLTWRALAGTDDYFDPVPLPSSLFELATAALADHSFRGRARIRHVRIGLIELARQLTDIIQAEDKDPAALFRRSAEWIAASDRSYFTGAIRRKSIVPILVENPNPFEKGLAKGFASPELGDVSETLRFSAAVHLLSRRLEDGDIALERYDISKDSDTDRAINLLEALIPANQSGENLVWLWINGPLDVMETHQIHGIGPLDYLPGFRRTLNDSNINLARLRLFAKPDLSLPVDPGTENSLRHTLANYAEHGTHNALDLTYPQTRKLGL